MTGMSGFSIFSYTSRTLPRPLIRFSSSAYAASNVRSFVNARMSSRDGFVNSDEMSQSIAPASARRAGAICEGSGAASALSLSVVCGPKGSSNRACAPNILCIRSRNVLNPNSSHIRSSFSMSRFSRHGRSGSANAIGASRRIVASDFEKRASSSCSFRSPIMRAFTPFFRNASSPFLSCAYIFSIVPNPVMSSVAVFSPMPGMPLMLSEGSPRSPFQSGISTGRKPNRSTTAFSSYKIVSLMPFLSV